MSDVIDPSDMKFYEQEARKYCEQISRYCDRSFMLTVQSYDSFKVDRGELQILIICGNYKKAVDVANKIINKYFIKRLLGDLCER